MSFNEVFLLKHHRQHYNVNLEAIEVGGQFLSLPTDMVDAGSSTGTIIDSGTTLAYLPSEVYKELMAAVCPKDSRILFLLANITNSS